MEKTNEEIIVLDGKAYTKEDILELYDKVWNAIKKIVEEIVEDFIENWNYIKKHFLVGCKRNLKIEQLEYYQSISKGKSNNWRKSHGLPLKRRM